MKIKPYVTKLSSSQEYKKFQKKYENAFMMAGFFILDFENGKNTHQLDYYVPSEKKIAAFTMDGGVTMQMLDMVNSKMVPERLDMKTNVDLDAIYGILEDEMKNRGITEEIRKIIAILQNVGGKKVWNLNCVLSGMDILKAHVDDESQTVLKMEKSSILDYIKKMPGGAALNGMKGAQKMPQTPGQMPSPNPMPKKDMSEVSEEELKEEIKTLNKMEEEIEVEKKRVEFEIEKKSSSKKTIKSKTNKK